MDISNEELRPSVILDVNLVVEIGKVPLYNLYRDTQGLRCEV